MAERRKDVLAPFCLCGILLNVFKWEISVALCAFLVDLCETTNPTENVSINLLLQKPNVINFFRIFIPTEYQKRDIHLSLRYETVFSYKLFHRMG